MLKGKNRTVNADVFLTDVTPAAFPQTTLHLTFERGYDLIIGKAKILKLDQCEMYHYGRATNNGYRVFGWWIEIDDNIWNQRHSPFPVIIAPVNRRGDRPG